MDMPSSFYCQTCGTENERGWHYCARCGRPLTNGRTGVQRISGIAFLLNEAATPRMRDVIGTEGAAALASSYAAELLSLNPDTARAVSAARAAREESLSARVPIAAARAAAPPREPRTPRDWSWLAEQQANLFLFAGAFLVVVAALIYVAYSGQAIDGSLKMSLLVLYTVAFAVAGLVCMRTPRVRIAGEVFFGIGALLVPLNFVAAYNIFSDRNLSATAMWLAGSLCTAVLYSLIASTGLGKHYAYSAGIAILSATAAGIAVAGVPVTWAPTPFLAVALAVSLADLAAPQKLRARVTSAWLLEARAVGPIAAVFVAAAALVVNGADLESSRWFLLPAAALAIAFYSIEAVARGERYALFAAAAALSMAGCSVVFGAELAPEHYALALIASGAVVYCAGRWALLRVPAGMRYEGIRRDAIGAGEAIVVAGVGFAILAVATAADPENTYTQQTSWSLFAAFAAAALFFAITLLAADADTNLVPSALAFALAFTGTLTAAVYGAGWPAEYYAFAFAGAALVLLALSLPRIAAQMPLVTSHDTRQTVASVAHGAALVAACVIGGAVYADAASQEFALQSGWLAPLLAATLALFYGAAAVAQPREILPSREVSFGALLAAAFAVALGVVYALDVSAEYYSFAFIVPAIGLAAAVHVRSPRLDAYLPDEYCEQAMIAARVASIAGIAIAIAAAIAATSVDTTYRPDSGAFLPVALLLAAAAFALDASRQPRYATSAALLACLTGAALGVAYAVGAGAHWYGVTLAATGILLAFAQPVVPAWLDRSAHRHAIAITMTAAWLGFEGPYVDYPRIAAGVHLAAALFYGIVAFTDDGIVALDGRREGEAAGRTMPLAIAWLYASGLALTLGYVHLLRGLSLGLDASADAFAFPMLGLSFAMLVAGAIVRRWRSTFTFHVYVMALLVDVAAIATAGVPRDLALVLTLSVAASLLVAIYENEPLLAAPAALFGFGAVAAWQRYFGWDVSAIAVAYTAIGIAAYAAGFAVRENTRRWSDALRAAGAAYAMIAPAVGFIVLANGTRGGSYGGGGFQESALYQWSTLGIALAGLMALVESSFARRGWVVVTGSAVLVVSLMLEIGHFSVRDAQVYATVAGLYLLLLGTVGLWRFRLIPEAVDAAPFIEVLGAATILLPSFVHALHGGWAYVAVVLAEASAFLLAGVALRRRGLIAAAMTAFVLVAVRVLFEAAQALPNWIIVLVAGMALLGVGVAILAGRERWDRWQEALLGWWDAMNTPEHPNGTAGG